MSRLDAEPIFQRIPVRAAGVGITSAVVAAVQTGLAEKAVENPGVSSGIATLLVLTGFAATVIFDAFVATRHR